MSASGSTARATPLANVPRRSTRVVAGLAILVLAATLFFGIGAHPAPPAPSGILPSAHHPVVQASPHAGTYQDCDGMYWSSSYAARYVPSFCYGHDEPTMNYISGAAGSGANASFSMVLPSDSSSYAQGEFYATIWFGGTVYDTASTAGGNQGFLELQFYPAAPYYTGTGSGARDCLPDGAYSPSFSAGANKWFACAIVWQLANSPSGILENAAYAGPINAGTSSAILVLKSNDHVFVNYSGIAQSTTVPWNISVTDTSTGGAGWASLKNGSLVLSPDYSTATTSNTLKWGASNPGAIAFAYEIGHAYTVSSCYPGDGACDSYWPARWASSGQFQLALPKMGTPGAMTFPDQIGLASSQGGERIVNSSSCGSPSTSTSKNCLYPWFVYRSGSYSFDYTSSAIANSTHDYRGLYQFPPSITAAGQYAWNIQTAPWGSVHFVVYPTNATATFSPTGSSVPLTLAPNRTAGGQFTEGLYWFNVSAPGCSRQAVTQYVSPGGSYNLTVLLPCGGSTLVAHAAASPATGAFPLPVNFTGSASGGTAPYSYSWDFADGGASTAQSPSHTYHGPGKFVASLIVSDKNGSGSLAQVTVQISTPSCAGQNSSVALGVVQLCHLNKTEQVAWSFSISKSDWYATGYIDIYAVAGTFSGKTPFKVGVGMGGTPGLATAKQKANGPNGHITLPLSRAAANKYHGWGTYWVVVNATGGSGGFCFIAALGNGTFLGPLHCASGVALPKGGPGGAGGGSSPHGSGIGPAGDPGSRATDHVRDPGEPGIGNAASARLAERSLQVASASRALPG